VTLFGQVANPDLKISAEKAVEHIPGVASVDNELEVLPGDLVDNDIRAGVLSPVGLSAAIRNRDPYRGRPSERHAGGQRAD
jgi:hypothetical protein